MTWWPDEEDRPDPAPAPTDHGDRCLRAAGVAVRYGPHVAVHGVDLEVRPGDLVAVTGPSGAGKTSLLAVLSGARPPAAGTVAYGGSAVRDRDDAVARGIVLVPQGNALVRILTALENVLLGVVAGGGRADGVEALRALEAVGLDEAADQLVEELSGGQQQRVAVARGLAVRGGAVLADEPTSELDAANREKVMSLLRAEASRGAAVLVTSHDPEAAGVCDAELRLDEGVPHWVRDDRLD